MKWKDKREELNRLINEEHISYEEIGRRYNVSGAAIKKAAKRLGINIPKRRSINSNETFNRGTAKTGICLNCGKEFILYKSSTGKYCSIKCQREFEHKEKYKLIIEGDERIMRANYSLKHFKKDILEEQENVCSICGCEPQHNGKPLVFILDHIDGNAANNKRSNLRMVCPNCDSQLPTYKSKNKNGARSYYRYHKFNNKLDIEK